MKAYIETFGCQMNESDSERITYLLEKAGYRQTDNITEADIIVLNTCTVREKAINRLYGHIGNLKRIKSKKRDILICVGGCASQDLKEKIIEDFPFVDVVFGTMNISELPELIRKRISSGKSICSVKKDGSDRNIFKVRRMFKFKAFIPIITGCDNYCSYCIVPAVRGKEKSIEADIIVSYAKELAVQGVIEVMLIGQNVNSYGKNLKCRCTFPELLEKVSDIEGLKRIRFMTSHPKDFSKELTGIIKERPNIVKHIHLPFQAGSDRILKKMNRGYNRNDYLNIIENIRNEIPDCSITTDIIVGFPGEERKDFLKTLDIVKKVRFNRAYTFIYSPRKGTRAAEMENKTNPVEKRKWFKELLEVQNLISLQENKKLENIKVKVLVEGKDTKNSGMLEGRMENNTIVNFKGSTKLLGKIVPVVIKEAKTFYLIGELYNGERQ